MGEKQAARGEHIRDGEEITIKLFKINERTEHLKSRRTRLPLDL